MKWYLKIGVLFWHKHLKESDFQREGKFQISLKKFGWESLITLTKHKIFALLTPKLQLFQHYKVPSRNIQQTFRYLSNLSIVMTRPALDTGIKYCQICQLSS